MTTNQALYTALRISRAATAIRRGRFGSYLRRSLTSTLVAKLTAGVRR